MKSIGIIRTTEHSIQYAGHLLQRTFVDYFSRTQKCQKKKNNASVHICITTSTAE